MPKAKKCVLHVILHALSIITILRFAFMIYIGYAFLEEPISLADATMTMISIIYLIVFMLIND